MIYENNEKLLQKEIDKMSNFAKNSYNVVEFQFDRLIFDFDVKQQSTKK